MKQEYSAEITVKSYYSENSVDIAEILERSVLLFIESEMCIRDRSAKEDIYDWLKNGHTMEELDSLPCEQNRCV